MISTEEFCMSCCVIERRCLTLVRFCVMSSFTRGCGCRYGRRWALGAISGVRIIRGNKRVRKGGDGSGSRSGCRLGGCWMTPVSTLVLAFRILRLFLLQTITGLFILTSWLKSVVWIAKSVFSFLNFCATFVYCTDFR